MEQISFDDAFSANSFSKTRCDTAALAHLQSAASGITHFVESRAGRSYNDGLYRIHAIDQWSRWTAVVCEAFPGFQDRVLCFAADWLGRQFAIDFARSQGGQYLVLMFEPGTGQALEIPATFMEFHQRELVEHQEAALAVGFYQKWRQAGGAAPTTTECVGYKTPLFLGGADDVANLEIDDMEVYWSVCGQILALARGHQVGDAPTSRQE